MTDILANPNALWLITAATLAALAVGTVLRIAAVRFAPPDVARTRLESLATWWVLTLLVVSAAILGRTALVIVFAGMSVLALHEFARLAPANDANRTLWRAAYALIAVSYAWIWLGWVNVFLAFLPLALLLVTSATLFLRGRTEHFVHTVGRVCLGGLLTGYCLGHAVLLTVNSPEDDPTSGIGWFLFLVILTATSDIAQALVGRRIGKRKMAPRVSPHKTWEGFLGGVSIAVLLALPLAHWLTPLNHFEAALAGLTIALFGFCGDLNMSAIKRDAGVKDSGRLLPGQGGMLDRIDSLTFSAPAFYYFLLALGHYHDLSAATR